MYQKTLTFLSAKKDESLREKADESRSSKFCYMRISSTVPRNDFDINGFF
jgi:hypothetical protein